MLSTDLPSKSRCKRWIFEMPFGSETARAVRQTIRFSEKETTHKGLQEKFASKCNKDFYVRKTDFGFNYLIRMRSLEKDRFGNK